MGNVALFIDEKNSKLKTYLRDAEEYKEVDFTPSTFDYKDIIGAAFGETIDGRIDSATCILPDEFVLYDLIKTPVFFGKNQRDMLKFELSARYPQHEEYKKIYVPMAKTNGQMSTVVFMTLGDRVESIKNAFKAGRLSLKGVTFEAAALAEAYLNVDTKKRGTTLLAVIRENYTKVLVIKDRSLLFFTSIPYGHNIFEVGSELKSAPSVLNRTELEAKGGKKGGQVKDNGKYLMRTLMEMRTILSEKYRLQDIALKYSINSKYSEFLKEYDAEWVKMHSRPEFFVSNNKDLWF